MKSPHRSPLLAAAAISTAAAISAVVACTTDDPRPGVGTGRSSSSSGGTTSGGTGLVDADVPDAPLDCGPRPGAAGAFTKQALLSAAADCAAWHACLFQSTAMAMKTAVDAHRTAPSEASLTTAKAAWQNAMDAWSSMELFQFGPVAVKAVDKYHGRSLRSWIHPWPDTNRCQVETQIANRTYETDGFQFVLPSARGLFALEYVLYYGGNDISCSAGSAAGRKWATLSADQIAGAKRDYATAVADNVLALAVEISNSWAPNGENFKQKLLAFDQYGSEQETLNVVAWSLMYPEREIKDWKVGGLAGFQATVQPSESPFAGAEISNIRTNLRAFRSLFQGCGEGGVGIGFDDWLTASGNAQLATDMVAALDRAQAAADAFPLFSQATQAQFVELYQNVKPLADLLKNSFFGSASPLNLKLPASAASDTD